MTCRLVVGLCRIPHRAAAAAAHTHGRLPAAQRKAAERESRVAPGFSSATFSFWVLSAADTIVAPPRKRRRRHRPPRAPPPPSFVVVAAATASASLHIIHPRATREGSQRNRGWWADLRRLQQWQQQPPSLLFPPFYHHYPGERARERETWWQGSETEPRE